MPIAKQDYFLDAKREKLVKEGSTDAAFLLARKGSPVPQEDVDKYGLSVDDDPKPQAEEPNIVISGGRETGPAIVKGEPIEGQQPEDQSRQQMRPAAAESADEDTGGDDAGDESPKSAKKGARKSRK